MRSYLLPVVLALVAMIGWAGLVVIATLNGWGRTALAPRGNAEAFAAAAKRKLAEESRGNAVFHFIEQGKLRDEYFVSAEEAVNSDSLFQVASLSKWITAWAVLSLVEAGKLDLDAPVATYLTRWKLPEGKFDNSKVTVRRLLSHTAGLTDGLGYAGFAADARVQSLEESLAQAADASAGADGRVQVGVPPGTKWEYSGGGYTLLQLLIEERTGEPFEAFMQRAVFQPLGMTRSTYSVEVGQMPNAAALYDAEGQKITHRRFTALAAACLYTTASDLTHFLEAHLEGVNGEPPGRGVLKPETLRLMRQPHAWRMGAAIWGLGMILYVPNEKGDFIIGHDGRRAPAINATARLNPATGDGIVVLETGHPLLATTLGGEWVFWQTGKIDLLMFSLVADRMVAIIAAGSMVILLVALCIGWRRRRRRATQTSFR